MRTCKGGTYRIVGDGAEPGGEGRALHDRSSSRRGDCNKLVPVTAVKTKDEGWIVNSLDLTPGRRARAELTGAAPAPDTGVTVVTDTIKPGKSGRRPQRAR